VPVWPRWVLVAASIDLSVPLELLWPYLVLRVILFRKPRTLFGITR
jgi:hypothetical protein